MNTETETVERPCPSCGAAIALEPGDLVVGKRIRCLHCNAEALVVQEWDERLGQSHWSLDDTDEDELPRERV
jgi:hypothetical protein